MGGRRNRQRVNSTAVEEAEMTSTLKEMRQTLANFTSTLSRVEEMSCTLQNHAEFNHLPGRAADSGESGRERTVRGSHTVSFADISCALQEFSGDSDFDVRHWINELTDVALMLNLSDLETTIYAKRLLTGTAKLALRSRPGLNTWAELKNFLLDEFATKTNSADIHRKLSTRKQNKGESVREYFLKMRELAVRGNVEDDALRQYVIDGLLGSPADKALLYGASNIHDFKQRLENYNKFRKSLVNSNLARDSAKRDSATRDSARVHCFNCGKQGHLSKNCADRSRGPKCFGCDEYGHKKADCPKSRNSGTIVNTCIAKRPRAGMTFARVSGFDIEALVDTGSDITILRADEYVRIGAPSLSGTIMTVRGLGSGPVETLGQFECAVELEGDIFYTTIHIMSSDFIKMPMIIGKDILKGTQLVIGEEGIKIKKLQANLSDCCHVVERDDLDIGSKTYRDAIHQIVDNYNPVGSKETSVRMKIILKEETPIFQNPRRLSPLEKTIVDQQIQEWLSKGIIQHSNSEFASPIVLANKKDGSKRLCIDFRRLNKEVIRDRYPLPLIEDQIDSLRDAKVFTSLDLENGFFHVPVEPSSRKYTSFVTPTGQYEFLRTPFGLCTSPTVFQKFINSIFKPLLQSKHILIYMDDIIIPARDEQECLERLKKVLVIASEYGLRIKWPKCQFLCKKVEYLGYEVSDGKIKPSRGKISAVSKFPTPRNMKNVQQFLGLTGYFRKFIPEYATIAKPLSDLLRKNRHFEFGRIQHEAFEKLKNRLTSQPVLAIYQPDLETELCTDASRDGYGAVLLQRSNDDQQFHPVYYYSRKTTPAESRYSSYELEALAIVSALKKLRVYLLGIHFKIITDCAAFKQTMSKKEISPRIAGWALMLQEYDFEIEHRSANKLRHADALSRNPVTMIIQTELLSRIRESQMKDERLKAIAELTKQGIYENYSLEHGILYQTDETGNKLLCVPQHLQNEVIGSVHNQGHFGTRKSEEILKREYAIPRLRERIEKYRLNCIPCILAERKQGKQEGFLNPIPKGEAPLSTYHLDHLGPLTQTKKGYRHIFTVVDDFTKFLWIYPVKTLSTDEVLQKLEQQKAVFGSPKRIITDRGTAFTSAAFEEYCREEGIKHTLITTGVPRGNGQVERAHRVIIPVLTKLSIDNPEQWYKHTQRVQRYLNSNWHRSLGRTPFEILIGVPMRSKEDLRLTEIITEEIIQSLGDERERLREEARKKIQQVQEENRKCFNRRRKAAHSYRVGDFVAISRTQFGPTLKILPKFLGPYKITKVFYNNRYEVVKVGIHEGPKITTTSADHMKPWPAPGEDLCYSETEASDEEENVLGEEGEKVPHDEDHIPCNDA